MLYESAKTIAIPIRLKDVNDPPDENTRGSTISATMPISQTP